MLLCRAWTQAGIDTLKTDARATRVLQFVRDEREMTEEERVLTQAGKELLDNTTHEIDEVETRTGTTIQWYGHLKGVDINTNSVRGWNPKTRNEGKELRYSEAVSSFTN